MDVPSWLRYVVLGVGTVLTAVCLWFVAHSVRRLNRRIAEFEEELEARKGAPLDPYAALAEIYAEQRPPREKRTKGP